MRKTTLTVGLLLVSLSACGSPADTPEAAATSAAAASSPSETEAEETAAADDATSTASERDDQKSSDSADTSTKAGAAKPMGTTQVIKTSEFEARVTMVDLSPNEVAVEYGDPPYGVSVEIEMIRGTWTIATSPVRFVRSNGAVVDRIQSDDASEGANELSAGDTNTEQFLFEDSAGSGVGKGARVTISNSDDDILATWLT